MNKLSDLEGTIRDRISPGQELFIALMDIARFEQLEAGVQEHHHNYDVDIGEIHRLIVENLAAALVSPNPYIREWAQFISKRKKKT